MNGYEEVPCDDENFRPPGTPSSQLEFALTPAPCNNTSNAIQHQVLESASPTSQDAWGIDSGKTQAHLQLLTGWGPAFCLPLQELDILVNSSIKVSAIYDTGSQIVDIQQDLVQSLGVCVNAQRIIEMEGANGTTNWTVGCIENLTVQVGDVPFKIHAHVVEHASYSLLLGRPFQQTLLCRFEDLPGGEIEISVQDPTNIARRVYLAAHPRNGCAP